MSTTVIKSELRADERGAVFVEKLIVYLPLMAVFFLTWELAEFTAASLVLQRASAAAGRAAVVVLPDDPLFYDGEDVGSYSGKRRDDIELAAGMILSSNPKFKSDFTVDVSDPPDSVGPIDVTVDALYDCGAVSLFCGVDGAIELTSTTTHTYQGAKYTYTSPSGGGIGGSTAALEDNYHAGERGGAGGFFDPHRAGERAQGITSCRSGAARANYNGQAKIADVSTQLTGAYGSDDMSSKALAYRCDKGLTAGLNVAVLKYRCNGDTKDQYLVAESSKNGNQHSEKEIKKEFDDETAGKTGCRVITLYTEREPCNEKSAAKGSSNCALFVSTDKGAKGISEGFSLDKSQVEHHFLYNPKNILHVDSDPFYADAKDACDRLKKAAQKANTCGITSDCNSVDSLPGNVGSTKDKNLCREYLQAKDELDGLNRDELENGTKGTAPTKNGGTKPTRTGGTQKTINDAMKNCPPKPAAGTKRPYDVLDGVPDDGPAKKK